MHNSILYLENAAVPPGAQTAALWHTDLFSNVPEDTDVFHVLASSPRFPEYVAASGQLYLIAPDGTITYKGPTQ